MARKTVPGVVAVLLGVCGLLLGGCAKIDKQVDAVAEWADQDPAFSDLTVQQQLAGGIPTKQSGAHAYRSYSPRMRDVRRALRWVA